MNDPEFSHSHVNDPEFSRTQVCVALNRAADDICTEAGLPDEGVRDGLNLLVNATLTYLSSPSSSLEDVLATNYDPEVTLDTVLDWLHR